MFNIFMGPRPDLTAAQAVAALPVLAAVAHALGLLKLSESQQKSLGSATLGACVLSGGDALLRVGRNLADAKIHGAALLTPTAFPEQAPVDPDHEQLLAISEDLPSDEEEFAAPPPSARPPSG